MENLSTPLAYLDENGDIRDTDDNTKLAVLRENGIGLWNRHKKREAVYPLSADALRSCVDLQRARNDSKRLDLLENLTRRLLDDAPSNVRVVVESS